MKGYRFYEEFGTKQGKRKGVSQGNVVAVQISPRGYADYHISNGVAMGEGFTGLYQDANSPVCYGSFSFDWLAETCKRVSEARAREVHPELFRRLDTN